MGVFPSDHVIAKPRRYLQLARAGFRAAADGKMALLGIVPRWAETGYGYVELPRDTKAGSLDPVPVVSFREKPDAATASKYLSANCFYWNAGMFFWRASVLLDALREHLPKTASLLASLPRFADRRFKSKLNDLFPRCENISIDYAVLERAKNVVALACEDIGWNDVGSWNAVYELVARDREGNAARSVVISAESSGNYIDAGNKLVALLGARNLVVVDTPDALLIADRQRAQQVGDIVKLLEQHRRHDLL
jgi:mannose-1-phosphate guanylyltransferase